VIVISGALVLVALILLIIGVVGPDLTFVYASIAVSLVSLVFLVIGILQRRGEAPPAGEDAPAPAAVQDDDSEGVTAVIPAQGGDGSRKISQEAPVAATADEELKSGGTVLVVQGRPRYHVEGCRYLSGRTPEPVDVLDAREEGFTPCGVCRPDDLLAESAAPPDGSPKDSTAVEQEPLREDVVEQEVVEEDVPGVEVAPPGRRAAKAPARKAAAKRGSAAPARASRTSPTRAVGPAATRAAAAPESTSSGKAPRKTAPKAVAPRKTAAPGRAAAAATPTAGAATPAGSVVVIPDRGRFHRAECRYVRDVDQAEVLPKSAASRQGYAACGVCKP
jgi:hypothetical protein